MKNRWYYAINIITISTTLIFLYCDIFLVLQSDFLQSEIIGWGAVTVFMAAAVYIIKGIRLYLIMLEHRITIERYIKTYIKTTLVTLMLPLKIGELFKMYCYGVEMGDYRNGCVCILVDRYFDTIPLILLLVGFTFFSSEGVSFIVLLLLAFMVSITIIYLIFPSSYRYINKFCIIHSNSQNGIKTLKILEGLKKWYGYTQNMIRGRNVILIMLSAITWLIEYGIIMCLSVALHDKNGVETFITYINSIFIRSNNTYVHIYVLISAIIFMLLSCLFYGRQWLKRRPAMKSQV